jgi:hypothetical protein
MRCLVVVLLCACSAPLTSAAVLADAGAADAGAPDAGLHDAGWVDAGASLESGLSELLRIGGPLDQQQIFTFGCGGVGDGAGGFYVALDTDVGLDGPPRGVRDLALARLDADGGLLWVRQFGDEASPEPLFTRGCALDVDAEGNVYLGGLINGRGSFLGEVLPSLFTALAVSFAPDGTRRWHRLLGAPGGSEAMALRVEAGEVRVLGYSSGELQGQPGLGRGDVFLARLDAARGTVHEVQLFGGAQEDLPVGLQPRALAFTTTDGVLGARLATVLVPLPPDRTAAAPLSVPTGLEALSTLEGALVTASLEVRDAGPLAVVRRLDERGEVLDEALVAAGPGRLLVFECGAPGCVLVFADGRQTSAVALTPGLERARSLLLEGEADGGAPPPLIRAATPVADGFLLVGSQSGSERADAVVWRWRTIGD